MPELTTHEIASVSTVRLYRNAEGTVVMAEEVAPLSFRRIGELFDQHGTTDISNVSGFYALVTELENEFFGREKNAPRLL